MRRGTTVENTFTTDIDLSEAEVIFITYKQKNRKIIEKSIDDITVTADSLSLTLTQTDTLAFAADAPVEVQIRARFASGSAVASNVMTTTVDKILKEGVI